MTTRITPDEMDALMEEAEKNPSILPELTEDESLFFDSLETLKKERGITEDDVDYLVNVIYQGDFQAFLKTLDNAIDTSTTMKKRLLDVLDGGSVYNP